MIEKKRSWNDWPVWLGVSLVLVVAYGGAYAVTVQAWADVLSEPDLPERLGPAFPEYSKKRRMNAVLQEFFWPAHQIDRRIRPEHWMSTEEREARRHR